MRFYFLLAIFPLLFSCKNDESQSKERVSQKPTVQIDVPEFNADSAYNFVAKQVEFGPRVPDTKEHVATGNWLEEKLKTYTDRVYLQEGTVKKYDGTQLNFKNIIGSFNPENPKRILLCAHWDTRPYADHDKDQSRHREPIDGANDGASGVGVLLEIARQLSLNDIDLGIDIILFDVEDQGQPEFSDLPPVEDSYCLGSQYWSKQPHVSGYRAKYGILLDMVGAKGSRFLMEQYSQKYAPHVVRNVWNTAAEAGYSDYFPFKKAHRPIVDDHYYINMLAGIPTIDIIALDNSQRTTFMSHWHTHEDNMEVIDKNVLKAVGQTVLRVVFKEEAGTL